MNERLQLTDSIQDAIVKLSEGNPGVVSVCSQLYREGPRIDPDAAFGGLAPLMSLDTLNIYGADIWMLFKDVCKQNLVHTIAVLQAVQLGFLNSKTLKDAIQGRGRGVDVEATFAAVCQRLPNFEKANALEAAEVISQSDIDNRRGTMQ